MKKPALVAGLAVLYFASARFGLTLANPDHPSATLLWAPTGIAIAAAFRFGPWMLVGIWLGAFFANLTTDTPMGIAAVIGVGNTLEGGAGALMLYLLGYTRLKTALQLVCLTLVVATVALISANIGTAALVVGDVLPSSEWGPAIRDWYLGDLLGGIVVGGVLLRLRLTIPTWELGLAALALALALGSIALGGSASVAALVAAVSALIYITLRNDNRHFG